MTKAAAEAKKDVQISVGSTDVQVSPDGQKVSISGDCDEVMLNGVVLTAPAPARLLLKTSAPANDTAIAAAKDAFERGQKMEDGSVYAGLTPDGKQQIFALPADLEFKTKTRFLKRPKITSTFTFNKAAKAVKELNADQNNNLGHTDWQIGSLDVMRVLQKNQNEGSLKGTFNTTNKGSGSVFPDWYWSSTEHRGGSSYVLNVRFPDGYENCFHKDNFRLSCRPVRLVPVVSPSLG